jgi:hypothetical protein
MSDFHSDLLTNEKLLDSVYEYTKLYQILFSLDENSEINKYDAEYIEFVRNSMLSYINSIILLTLNLNDVYKKNEIINGFNDMLNKINSLPHLLSENNPRDFISIILQR